MNASQDSALLGAIMNAAVDAIVISDMRGEIIRANKAATRLFGYGSDQLMGQSINVLMPQAMADLHEGFMDHHLATGEARILGVGRDVEGIRQDGSVFPIHLSVDAADIDGEKLFVGILHDLTERRAAQAAVARSQRLDAIGQLTGGIAHDFNNLLTVVIGNLELLQMRGALDEKQESLIADALESAELGADLTSRLLIFARKGKLEPIRVDLRDQCRGALAILKRTIGERYSIRTEFADTLSDVLVDPVQLQSALLNLALNARDAMPFGGEFLISVADVRIEDDYMAQEAEIETGEYVRVMVSDDGDGMSPDAQKRAFEPFFTTKADSGGTGLGLAMVYGFVRQSGGHITLYSEVGHGTSFGLYFPVVRSVGQPAGSGEMSEQGRLPHGSGQMVLIVEDNPRVRKLSIERVRDLGYFAEGAPDGDTAYQMLQSGLEVDLVFSDLVMPGGLNGYALAAKLKAEFPTVKVLLTSGYASDVVTDRMGGHADHSVLHKPYRQAELAERLHALLGKPA